MAGATAVEEELDVGEGEGDVGGEVVDGAADACVEGEVLGECDSPKVDTRRRVPKMLIVIK